jgi:hypothetical protein
MTVGVEQIIHNLPNIKFFFSKNQSPNFLLHF